MATKSRPRAKRSATNQPPTRFQQFGKKYPAVMKAYEALGEAAAQGGPLNAKTRALVKLGIASGAWREGAVHSHTRRALDAGCTADEIRHVVLLATTTLGFPSMMAVRTWVEDVLGRK
jgi:alkylhydroperoxidase/carboxymuconolactone decarboxylase family protein YurZ